MKIEVVKGSYSEENLKKAVEYVGDLILKGGECVESYSDESYSERAI